MKQSIRFGLIGLALLAIAGLAVLAPHHAGVASSLNLSDAGAMLLAIGSVGGAGTNDTLQALIKAAYPTDGLAKSLTTSSGLVNYDLQGPAKNLYPVITPLRNKLPRVKGNGGTSTNWKAIFGITGSGVKSMPWVPEGQRSGRQSYSAVDKFAAYRTIGEEDSVTEEAINAAQGFEDVASTLATRLLQGTMIKEEFALMGGNSSIALGTPTTPTLSASGSGATLPAATYSVIVVALTFEGYSAASLSGGVVQAQSITGADGKTYTLNGGSSQKSAAATQAATLGQTLFASTPAIQGAMAYAWYVGTAGSEKLEAITTINSAAFSAPLAGTGQAATAITVDASKNASYGFDGISTVALASGSGAYVKSMATGTAGTGTPLTAGGRGNVVEIDAMLQSMWDQFRLSPTVIWVNSQELKNITSKVLSNASGPLLRYEINQQDPYGIVANGVVQAYFNPWAMNGGIKIPILLHPNVPAGTIVAWCENLPQQYQSSQVPNVAEVHVRKDYMQTFWPQVTRQRDVGVYAEETLAVYAPFATAVIYNIANG